MGNPDGVRLSVDDMVSDVSINMVIERAGSWSTSADALAIQSGVPDQ
jgi:hypothetical protein